MLSLREDARLRKLADARDEHKAEVRVEVFQRRIERLQLGADGLQPLLVVQHGEQWRVVFVDEDDDLFVSLGIKVFHEVAHPRRYVAIIGSKPITFFCPFQLCGDDAVQVLHRPSLGHRKAEVKYGILLPFLFQLIDGQSFEQLFPPIEICMERAYEQRFAKAAWT